MTQRKLQLQFAHSVVPRYGFAVAWVAIALAIAFFLEHHEFHRGALPLFLLAVALSAWYGGVGPAMLAIVLSILSFDYYFAPPVHTFNFALEDAPAFLFLLIFGALIAGFSAVRRRVEAELLQARDKLEFEVAARTQQASLLNLTHDTIFVRDMNEVITYWNRGGEELYGWRPEQAIGKSSHELLRTVFPSPLDDIQAEFLRTGRWEGELKHTKADGTQVIVASRWSLRRDEREQPIAALETNNDITVRKRREQEIQSVNQELAKRSTEVEAINKELEAFAYSVSHDLRAPLRHMAGFAELLRNSAAASLNEKSRRYLTVILEAANRMGTLIDDLLAFSRISRAEAHYSTVSLKQIVQDAIAEVRQDANERKIVWKIDSLPEWYGDRSMLRQAMVNLISNAVKFTRTRSQAEIEIGCTDHKNDHAVLFVRDNGVGFDMKYSNKLFGVFQRLHPQEAFEGTGIGLATVQRIVQRHGGRVWAEGKVEGGATFYFSLSRTGAH
jgi:PAS domain S-box-containing protein